MINLPRFIISKIHNYNLNIFRIYSKYPMIQDKDGIHIRCTTRLHGEADYFPGDTLLLVSKLYQFTPVIIRKFDKRHLDYYFTISIDKKFYHRLNNSLFLTNKPFPKYNTLKIDVVDYKDLKSDDNFIINEISVCSITFLTKGKMQLGFSTWCEFSNKYDFEIGDCVKFDVFFGFITEKTFIPNK